MTHFGIAEAGTEAAQVDSRAVVGIGVVAATAVAEVEIVLIVAEINPRKYSVSIVQTAVAAWRLSFQMRHTNTNPTSPSKPEI